MNRLEERVGALIDSGRGDLATDLLRASFHSRGIDDVEFVTDDRVKVVTGPFHGEHEIEVESDGPISIEAPVRYRFVGENIETAFKVWSLTDAEHQTIRSALRADNDPRDQEEGNSTATAAADDSIVFGDGGHPEQPSSGARNKLLKVLTNVLP